MNIFRDIFFKLHFRNVNTPHAFWTQKYENSQSGTLLKHTLLLQKFSICFLPMEVVSPKTYSSFNSYGAKSHSNDVSKVGDGWAMELILKNKLLQNLIINTLQVWFSGLVIYSLFSPVYGPMGLSCIPNRSVEWNHGNL